MDGVGEGKGSEWGVGELHTGTWLSEGRPTQPKPSPSLLARFDKIIITSHASRANE